MNNNGSSSYCEQDQSFKEKCNIEYLLSQQSKVDLHYMEKFGNSFVVTFPGKTLNNPNRSKL